MNNFYNYPYYNYRCNNPLPPPPKPPPPKPPPKPGPKKKKKFDFKALKKDTCKSLNDVEHFLCNFNNFVKYIELYKILKK